MSTTTGTSKWRWTGLLKRAGLAAVFFLVLFYLIPHGDNRLSWQSSPETKLHAGEGDPQTLPEAPSNAQETNGVQHVHLSHDEIMKEVSQPIANVEWGLMGKQVKMLADWAGNMNSDERVASDSLTDALVTRFPFLKDMKIYKPWAYSDGADVEVLAGSGLVMCVGSRNFHMAAHLIVSLRRVLGSKIPIEIAYAGDNDLRPQHRDYLKELGEDITLINLLEAFPAAEKDLENSGWAMKPFSVLASKHTKVMLVDADALLLSDPSSLFESHPELNRTGTLFYHDRAALGGGDDGLKYLKAQIAAAGITTSKHLTEHSLFYTQESWYEADSGLVAIDKSRPDIFMSMVFVTWLNTKAVREEVSYKFFYGDKETFWIAMELCSVEYYFEPWYAGSMGHITGEYSEGSENQETQLCSTHMLHMDHSVETPFWINGGIYQHKDNPDGGFADISHYWQGNIDGATIPKWWWEQGNVACLKMKGVRPVPSDMLIDLHRMYQNAAIIDEEIKQISD